MQYYLPGTVIYSIHCILIYPCINPVLQISKPRSEKLSNLSKVSQLESGRICTFNHSDLLPPSIIFILIHTDITILQYICSTYINQHGMCYLAVRQRACGLIKGSGVIKIKVMYQCLIVCHFRSHNNFRSLLLKMQYMGQCQSMKFLLLVQGQLFIEIETKH